MDRRGLDKREMSRRPNARRPWTAEEHQLLRTLLEGGASITLIAAKLKRNITAVKARASVIRVSLKRKKPALKATGK